MGTTEATPKSEPRPKMNRAEYEHFLQQQRALRGDEWYQRKLAEMRARDLARGERRKAALALWRSQVDAWSAAGGFEETLRGLALGEPLNTTGGRNEYRVMGVKFEVSLRKQACCRWDGKIFGNGKRGRSGARGLATCYFELVGSNHPARDAQELLAQLSGIQMEDVEITPDVANRLEQMRAKADAEARARAEADLREDPMPSDKQELIPRRITDPKAVEELTLLLAEERSFPLEFARQVVEQGIVWFGVLKIRDQESGQVIDTGRAIVCSEVRGFATGNVVGYCSRELRKFWPKEEGKGKNLGAVAKGAVMIGAWTEQTRRLHVFEGVYDALAYLLMRQRNGVPLAADESVHVLGGSRMPERLLEICRDRQVAVELRLDNDISGFEMAAAFQAWCAANGGPACRACGPASPEVTVSLADTDWGRAQYLNLAAGFRAKDIPFQFLPAEDGRLRVVAATTAESCALLKELKIADQTEHGKEHQLRLRFHRKDWNELLQRHYRTRAVTTVGLPAADATLEAEFDAYMESVGATSAEAASLRRALLVYPAFVEGERMAVWTSIDPTTGTVWGFRAEGLLGEKRTAAGASWHAGFGLGRITPGTEVLVVANTPSRALEAWRTHGQKAYTVLPAPGAHVPDTAAHAANQSNLFVTPAFGGSERAVEKAAALAAWARRAGVAYRAPATPAPDVAPSI